ncbi:hypothetical protein BDR07DRAFT_1382720 [Suillus spraguei]|nr:hypothetical protein BDR07DRAFT_1382720 [Suillus spraguei]
MFLCVADQFSVVMVTHLVPLDEHLNEPSEAPTSAEDKGDISDAKFSMAMGVSGIGKRTEATSGRHQADIRPTSGRHQRCHNGPSKAPTSAKDRGDISQWQLAMGVSGTGKVSQLQLHCILTAFSGCSTLFNFFSSCFTGGQCAGSLLCYATIPTIHSLIIANPNEIICQFTEDALAAKDHICERPSCCAKINQASQYLSSSVAGHCRPDPQTIWQSVNAAQRKSSINPPPVVAVPDWTMAAMGPPPIPHHCTTTGPDVAIPTSWQGAAALPIPSRATGSIGYSEHHGSYATQHHQWSHTLFAGSGAPGALAQTISLKISAVHEVGGRKKLRGEPIGDIDAPSLIDLALVTVMPKLHAYGGLFSWRNNEFVVQDLGWVDLSMHQSLVPYFYSQCLQPTQKGSKALIFKTKQFTIMVVVPEGQWREFENWQEDNEMTIKRSSHCTNAKQSCAEASRAKASHATTKDTSYTYSEDPLFDLAPNTSSVAVPSLDTVQSHETSSNFIAPDTTTAISIKGTHEHATSSTSSTISPPHKYYSAPLVSTPLVLLCSPNHDHLKVALKIGGGANLNMKQVSKFQNKNIQFYSIHTWQLNDLLKYTQYHSFSVDNADSSVGYVSVDMSPEGCIGIGRFKTAHPGWLTLMSPPTSGLGSQAHHDVVVKCPFYKVYPKGTPASFDYRIRRFALANKLPKLFREANVLYWAKVLLGLVYDFIDHAMAGASYNVLELFGHRFHHYTNLSFTNRFALSTQGTCSEVSKTDAHELKSRIAKAKGYEDMKDIVGSWTDAGQEEVVEEEDMPPLCATPPDHPNPGQPTSWHTEIRSMPTLLTGSNIVSLTPTPGGMH